MCVDRNLVISWAAKIYYKQVDYPIKYLGFPLGANPLKIQTWEEVTDKVEMRLAS